MDINDKVKATFFLYKFIFNGYIRKKIPFKNLLETVYTNSLKIFKSLTAFKYPIILFTG